MQAGLTIPAAPRRQHHRSWLHVLAITFGLFLIGIVVLGLTGNANLFPTVMMLGNFMIPASYVAFFYERRHLSRLTMPTTLLSFFYGGVLGVFSAALLEPLLVQRLDFRTAFVIGLIEEFAKILGVLVLARRIRHDQEVDGLILGAAAGMGFAALESNGYAFTSFLTAAIHGQGALAPAVLVTLLRGVLSPLGHGTWTAILTGVLFRESRDGRWRLNRAVIGAYLTVVILHGLWDGLPGLVSNSDLFGPYLLPIQAALGIAGLVILWRHWREARRLQEAGSAPAAAEAHDQAPASQAPDARNTPAADNDDGRQQPYATVAGYPYPRDGHGRDAGDGRSGGWQDEAPDDRQGSGQG